MEPPLKHLFLITGTTRGIGKALVESARCQPDSLVISFSRDSEFVEGNHQNIYIDLNDTAGIGPALKRIRLGRRSTGQLIHTVLINNAGVLEPVAPISDHDDVLIARNIQVNLTAPLILSGHFFDFAKTFPGRKWIVNITSGASRAPYYGWSAYGAAKAGLDMVTRAMAIEFARIDPTFAACAVAPGTVDTGMQTRIRNCDPKMFDQVHKFIELKASGALYPPKHVGETLIRLLMTDRFANGERYDLREMDG